VLARFLVSEGRLGCLVALYCEASSSSLPTPMARNARAVRAPFPAYAIGTQPRPTRCEYLGWSRVEQADRTPTLRAGNLHGIPSRTASSKELLSDGSTTEPAAPHNHKIRPSCRRTGNGTEWNAQKRVDRRTVGKCKFQEAFKSTSNRATGAGRPAVTPCRGGADDARLKLLGDESRGLTR
jgi:hypothetical protein